MVKLTKHKKIELFNIETQKFDGLAWPNNSEECLLFEY